MTKETFGTEQVFSINLKVQTTIYKSCDQAYAVVFEVLKWMWIFNTWK